jgi:hypothetical protein
MGMEQSPAHFGRFALLATSNAENMRTQILRSATIFREAIQAVLPLIAWKMRWELDGEG